MKRFAPFAVLPLLTMTLVLPVYARTTMAASPVVLHSGRAGAEAVIPVTTQQPLQTATLQDKQAFQDQQASFRQKLRAERQMFKASLAKIKDQRKQALVADIADRIASVSAEKTAIMHAALDQMTTILSLISTDGQTLKSRGVDTSALDQAVAAAQQAITTADASVTAQAGKVYTPVITTDSALRLTVGQTVSQFRTDLSDVYQQVVAAKRAVMRAAMELAKIKNAAPATSSVSGALTP